MLLSEQRRRHQYRDLLAVLHGDKRRPHGNFGFTEADIAANHSIHRLRTGHIFQYGFNCGLLIGRFLKREGIGKNLIVGGVYNKSMALFYSPFGMDFQ